MKTFKTLEELHAEWEVNGACQQGIEFNHSCKTLQEVFEKCPLKFRIWRLRRGYTQFAEHCPWDKLTGEQWERLLVEKPQYVRYCDWNRLDNFFRNFLLDNHPGLIKYCDAKTLEKLNWEYLLKRHPQLRKYKPKSSNHENL